MTPIAKAESFRARSYCLRRVPLPRYLYFCLTGHCTPNVHSAGCPDAKYLAPALIAVTVIFCGVHYFLDIKRIIFVYSSFWHRHEGINLRRRQRLVTFFLGTKSLDRSWIAFRERSSPAGTDCSEASGICRFNERASRDKRLADYFRGGHLCRFRGATSGVHDGCSQGKQMDGEDSRVGGFHCNCHCRSDAGARSGPNTGCTGFSLGRPIGGYRACLSFHLFNFCPDGVAFGKIGISCAASALTAVILSVLFHIPIVTMAKWSFVACALLTVLAFVSRLWFVGFVTGLLALLALLTIGHDQRYYADASETVASKKSPPLTTVMSVEKHFREWIQKRKDRTQGDGDPRNPYPVFIISAEGGGIYAAAAASMFLAKLQDDCPRFAQHVFAISGVSGGAIGATIFKSLSELSPAPSDPEASQAGCPLLNTNRPMTQAVTKIMEQDHFSPVVLSIIPEFLGGIIPKFLGGHIGRAEALEGSFEDNDAAERLKAPFLAASPNDSSTPRLVLNATWAETGYRVAFAPFTMGSSQGKDGTLYSFADFDHAG